MSMNDEAKDIIWICKDGESCPIKCSLAYGIRQDHDSTLTEFKHNDLIYICMPGTTNMCPIIREFPAMVRYGDICNGRRLS